MLTRLQAAKVQLSTIVKSQPPASKQSGDDASAGTAQACGSLNNSANTHFPGLSESTTQSSTGGYLDGVKSYLGFGGNKSADPIESRNAEEPTTSATGLGDNDLSSERSGLSSSGPSGLGDNGLSKDAGVGESGVIAGGATSADRSTDATNRAGESITDSEPSRPRADPIDESSTNRPLPIDSDVTTGRDPTESADPTTSDRAMTGGEEAAETTEPTRSAEPAGTSEPSEPGHLAEHENKLSEKETGSSRENKSAIPSAGGEQLGTAHWGESKVVPDNPKPKDEEDKGVSSKEGQPTGQSCHSSYTIEVVVANAVQTKCATTPKPTLAALHHQAATTPAPAMSRTRKGWSRS